MGNSNGIKIKNCENNEVIRDIKLKDNQKIIPFVHYIVKLNRFQVENFPKEHLVKEFTILDFITEKHNVIHIDKMELGCFINGLDYSYGEIPDKNQFILITHVLDNSPSKQFNIKPNYTLLLGDEDNYFDSVDMINHNIKNKKFKFVFYDLLSNHTFIADYKDKFQDLEIEKITLGIECGHISRLRLLKIIDKSSKSTNEQNHSEKLENAFLDEKDMNLDKDDNFSIEGNY